MQRFDEFRIFITDGESPFNNVASTPFRQPAYCILQKPVCPAFGEIDVPDPVDKPLKYEPVFPPASASKPDQNEDCVFDFAWFARGTTRVGYMVDFTRIIHPSTPADDWPANVTFSTPSHFKQGGDWLFTTDVPGTHTVTVTAEYNGGRSCTKSFTVIFV